MKRLQDCFGREIPVPSNLTRLGKFAITVGLLISPLFFPSPILADGMVIPPPNWRVWETGQKAVIWFENGQETLILSTTFKGDAADFGWIIPAPSRPQVEKGSDEIFTSLKELTEPKYQIQPMIEDFKAGTLEAPAERKVTVVETKKVDIYDISIVTSTESTALAEWLAENGYPYPVSQAYILDEYIENGWFFVAAKIDTEKLGPAVQGQLRQGHATPLLIKFNTPKIVYPLKISSITGDFYESDIFYQEGFNYSTGNWLAEPGVGFGLNNSIAWEGRASVEINPPLKPDISEIYISKVIDNLTPGRTYTFSAYVRSNQETNGTVYLNVSQNGLDSRFAPQGISKNWQRFILTFTAAAKSHRFNLVIQDFSPSLEGETFYLDAVQVELGPKATPFESSNTFLEKIGIPPQVEDIEPLSKIIAPDRPSYTPPPQSQERIEILLYVFDPKKKVEIPGFAAEYAGWVRPKEIEKLAFDDQGSPLLSAKKKMYLTKLNQTMTQSEMTNDLYPRYADKNRAVGRGSSIAVEPWMIVLIFGVPLLLETGFIVWLFKRRKKQK